MFASIPKPYFHCPIQLAQPKNGKIRPCRENSQIIPGKKGWRLGHIGPIYSLQAILCPKIKDTSQAYCWQLAWIRFIRFISGCQRGRGFQMYRWLGPEKTIWWFDEKYQLVILGMLLTRVTYWYTYRSSKTYRPSYLDYLHINFLKANQSSFPVILQPPTCKLFLELALISHN